jgi:hypothetical protein
MSPRFIIVSLPSSPMPVEIMMFTACLPQHSQNPTRTNRSSGLRRNSYLTHLFWLSRSKGMTVDIWIRDYNPPRHFQKKISGRSKHNDHALKPLYWKQFLKMHGDQVQSKIVH